MLQKHGRTVPDSAVVAVGASTVATKSTEAAAGPTLTIPQFLQSPATTSHQSPPPPFDMEMDEAPQKTKRHIIRRRVKTAVSSL